MDAKHIASWHELKSAYCDLAGITAEELMRDMQQKLVDELPEGTTAEDIAGCRGWLTTDVVLMRAKAVDLELIVAALPGWIEQGRPTVKKRTAVPTGNHGATFKQREWLEDLGFPLEETHGWTRAKASREIEKALSK